MPTFSVTIEETKVTRTGDSSFVFPDAARLARLAEGLSCTTINLTGFTSVQTTFVKLARMGTMKTRVRARPKMGYYVSDDGAVGRLARASGKSGKKRQYIFMVTHESESLNEHWCACLGHKGQDFKARDMWILDGHPYGGFFICDDGKFLECEEEKLKKRRTWSFHGETLNEGKMVPWAASALTEQMKKIAMSQQAVKAMADKSGQKPTVAPWAKKFLAYAGQGANSGVGKLAKAGGMINKP
jgi:hypothetical protein